MSCLCREGEKRCGWWISNQFNDKLRSCCINPHIEIQTKLICGVTQERFPQSGMQNTLMKHELMRPAY